MFLGYNTNGFAHHHPDRAIEVLREIGYRAVGITVVHQWLSPFDAGWTEQLRRLAATLAATGMRSVVETGARYLLDPRRKHHPTLLADAAADRQRRIDFYGHSIEAAARLGSDCVSIWSGARPAGLDDQQALDRLANGLEKVLRLAEAAGVVIGFEPEPGMFIDTAAAFRRLLQWIDAPQLQLTLDIGHLYCQGEVPIVDYIRRWSQRLVNVHIEDMRAGVHEHLMFGEGEIRFPPIIEALGKIGYEHGVYVELSHHSHEAPQAARSAYEFLQPLVEQFAPGPR